MKELKELYKRAEQCVDYRVDFALELLDLCKQIPSEQLNKLPRVQSLLKINDTTSVLSPEIVRVWPETIMDELHSTYVVFGYKREGDNWDVFQEMINGEIEWKATAETESLAEMICKLLNNTNKSSEGLAPIIKAE